MSLMIEKCIRKKKFRDKYKDHRDFLSKEHKPQDQEIY